MKSLITVVIVAVVLTFLEEKTRKQEKESKNSKNKFRIKLSFGFFWMGVIEAGMVAGILTWGEMQNDLDIYSVIFLILGAIPGILLILGPLSGFWEVFVDKDDITITKFFILKKHFLFSEIAYCKEKRGGWKVYVKDRKKPAFFVDRMAEGAGLFLKRIEAANIPVEEMIRDK